MNSYTWRKYIPVIRLLLKKSAAGTQTMTLNATDFAGNKASFVIEFNRGRVATTKLHTLGKELVEVLQQDPIVQVLLRGRNYRISFNNKHLLTIEDFTPADAEEANNRESNSH